MKYIQISFTVFSGIGMGVRGGGGTGEELRSNFDIS